MTYNIVFSVPVHERLDVVMDQILNICHFNPQCAIVLHIAQKYDNSKSLLDFPKFYQSCPQNVYINPVHVRTGFFDIIQAHISNYKYVNKLVDFDYFVMCASNELFVRSGLYEHIRLYDCGIGKTNYSYQPWRGNYKRACLDDSLSSIREQLGLRSIFWSQIEGTYYKRDIFGKLCDIIENHYDYSLMTLKYAREEIYFPCIIWGWVGNEINIKVEKLNKSSYMTFIPWRRCNMRITLKETIEFMDINQGGMKKCFAVKRVDRDINDYVRTYVREKCNYSYLLEEIGIDCPHFEIQALLKLARKDEIYRYKKRVVEIIKWYLFLLKRNLSCTICKKYDSGSRK